MSSLSVHSTRENGHLVLQVAGELDLAVTADLRTAADEALGGGEVTDVVVDLAGVTFIDSTGLGTLVEIRNAALEGGATMRVTAVQPAPSRVIEIAGLAEAFGMTGATG